MSEVGKSGAGMSEEGISGADLEQDYIVRATAEYGMIRAFAATTKHLVQEARERHDTEPVATAALGRLLTAGAMMGVTLKGEEDLLTLMIRGDGPLQGITVTADARGRVKGFVHQPHVWVPLKRPGKLDVGAAVGKGTLTVIRDQAFGEPYSSQVELATGEIGDDLTYYFVASEQVPTSVGLGVLVDTDKSVRRAGGFLIQLMPDCSEAAADRLEQNLSQVGSVTGFLEQGMRPEDILNLLLEGLSPEILEKTPTEFYCNCSRERVSKVLLSMGREELEKLIREDHGTELECHFCGEKYRFTEEELRQLAQQ